MVPFQEVHVHDVAFPSEAFLGACRPVETEEVQVEALTQPRLVLVPPGLGAWTSLGASLGASILGGVH